MLASLLLNFGYSAGQVYNFLEGDLKEHVIPELGVTSRQAQITLGTEWGRNQIHPDLWQRCWDARAERLPSGLAMNDSVRFPNEEAGIRRKNGVTIMIVRPGVGPAAFKWERVGRWLYQTFGLMWGVHDSERVDRLNPDFVIHNTGSLGDLYRMIDWVMEMWGEWGTELPDAFRPLHFRPEMLL
jgi:hypothetical protein